MLHMSWTGGRESLLPPSCLSCDDGLRQVQNRIMAWSCKYRCSVVFDAQKINVADNMQLDE